MKTSRKEFIKEAHNHACSEWKQKIENEFPKLFKSTELEVGKWYKMNLGNGFELAFKSTEKDYGYGFNQFGNWQSNCGWGFGDKDYNWIPSTDKEVEQALIKEAEKRGFKKGITMICIEGAIGTTVKFGNEPNLIYNTYRKVLSAELANCSYTVFKDGEWAEIIPNTITKAEAEKILGKTITID